MKRRGFLSLLTGAALAPALPVPVVSATGAARTGYARLLAGLAEYHVHVNGAHLATPSVFRSLPKPAVKDSFDRFTKWLEQRNDAQNQPEPETQTQACEMHAQEIENGQV